MKKATALNTLVLWFALATTALGQTYGSVEPIANTAVIDTASLRGQSLGVREAFAQRLLQCGVVDQLIALLSRNGSVRTINGLNTRFEVGAGGFAGETNPSYVYTVADSGPNAASKADIKVLTDSLAYVMSQGSAFLLDADNAASFDFPALYVVLNFPTPPPLQRSAALFEAVGRINPNMFDTDTSGYTQYGRAYLSLQSDVSAAEFIEGYVQAAALFGIEYTPIVDGAPAMFLGGAAFTGNDWTSSPNGEEYLARIPPQSHSELARLRAAHLRFTQAALRFLEHGDIGNSHRNQGLRHMSQLQCR